MSEFHRMITYLYLYEQGTKSRNVGFAKMERRDQRCLLEIHMKNTGCSLSPVPVYFYIQKEDLLAGIPLGNFSLTRGSGDFKTVLEAKNLKESGYCIDDVKGIYIPLTAQMILVSQWDDDEFHRENFVDLSDIETEHATASQNTPMENKSVENSSIENTPTKNTATKNNSNAALSQNSENIMEENKNLPTLQAADTARIDTQTAETITEKQDISPAPTKDDSETDSVAPDTKPTPADQDKSPFSQQDKETRATKSTDALKAVEALPRSEEEIAGFRTIPGRRAQSSNQNSRHSQNFNVSPNHAQASDTGQNPGYSQADTPENWNLRWRFILENYPVMTPFAGDEHTLCVRMELKDLRQLPKQYWYLGNNSFLLHGFFNYRYFILGMTEEFSVRKWFIGIPGVFQNPERVMAALFGFPEFRSEKPSPINTGEFGYWYRYLNELSEPSKK